MVNFVEYITVCLLTAIIAIFIIRKIANTILGVHVTLKVLALCACGAIFINLILPKFFISYSSVGYSVLVALICSAIFSYYIAYYNRSKREENNKNNHC